MSFLTPNLRQSSSVCVSFASASRLRTSSSSLVAGTKLFTEPVLKAYAIFKDLIVINVLIAVICSVLSLKSDSWVPVSNCLCSPNLVDPFLLRIKYS